MYHPSVHWQQLEGNIGAPTVEFFDDFIQRPDISETADAAAWLMTVIDGGAAGAESITIRDNVAGGVLRSTANAADNDGLSFQLNGTSFKVAADSRMVFAARMAVVDVSETDWFVGLAAADTAILSGVTESIGFRCPDSTGDIDYVVENASTETTADTGSDVADATMLTLSFEVIGNSMVKFYVNGVFKSKVTTNIPDGDDLTVTFEFRNDGAAANSLDMDYIYVASNYRE